MNTQHENWKTALPQKFSFYHLGDVELTASDRETKSHLPQENQLLIAVSIHGDQRGILVGKFLIGTDVEMAKELVNTIGSQLVTTLCREQAQDLMISPPIFIDDKTFHRFELNYLSSEPSRYHYFDEGLLQQIQIYLFWESKPHD